LTIHQPASDEGITWRKASRSNAGNNCVEIARTTAGYLIRDSKDPAGARLAVDPDSWAMLMSDIRSGRLFSYK
jgi:hypothetical protein